MRLLTHSVARELRHLLRDLSRTVRLLAALRARGPGCEGIARNHEIPLHQNIEGITCLLQT
jgi:hypothetical protein